MLKTQQHTLQVMGVVESLQIGTHIAIAVFHNVTSSASREFQNEHHTTSHNLQAVRAAEGSGMKTETRDSDYSYSTTMPGGYNYLDPNFMPAV